MVLIVSVSTKKYRKNAGKRARKHTFLYFLMKIIVFAVVESQKSRLFTTNYDKKRKLGLLVQRVKGFLVRMVT